MSSTSRYRAAGVDLDLADETKRRIAGLVESARTSLSRGAVGGFGGMVRVPAGMSRPTLVLSTDGVGTKVLVAIRAGRHDTVGEDLVNHCVNDILVHGARPLAFLDYIAGVAISPDTVAQLVEGVTRGCRAHDMPLVGGETAQLPDLYHAGHYDLAGTIVGVVEEDEALVGAETHVGDAIIGYASSGLHTNGYTLARRIAFTEMKLDPGSEVAALGTSLGEALLAVHRSYDQAVRPALRSIRALAHITGGGISGNLPRSLPEGLGARVERDAWPAPAIFRWLQEAGRVADEEMYRVFNMGIGMIAVVGPPAVTAVRETASRAGVETWVIGEIVRGSGVAMV